MKESVFTVTYNAAIAENTFRLRLEGDTGAVEKPGQFVNISVENGFLRRPISVCDRDERSLTLIYRAVGRGTRWLSERHAGDALDLLTGLGNGFDLTTAGEKPLLLGGGVGTAPLFWLARRLCAAGAEPFAALGFRTGAEVFYEEEFRALGCRVAIATEDGSRGTKGFVTDIMPEAYSEVFACGPLPMLRAVSHELRTGAQFSLEERMGCGFGACMGCTCETKAGAKRVCKDGPVFRREELPW
ncbi:MAG: dihydroorotate dehydrogenase electron transfer subunit [Oscillospiraceae bacterium]|nr:dihydroorotate dehydrogenase electron transfer subunit [Oscillospiraceae bacterium]